MLGRALDWLRDRLRRERTDDGTATEEPLRAELLSLVQLRRFATELARQHEADEGPAGNRLLPRLADNARVLRESHKILVDALAAGARMSPSAEWLLDNFYLVEQQIHLARLHLPRTYSRRLPRLTHGPMRGLPRVYAMAFELISHLDGLLDAETATAFVAAYQTVQPLRLGELWAFPIALRLGLIENLRRVAVRTAHHRREKDDGIAWAERTLAEAEHGPTALIRVLAEFAEQRPRLSAPFLEEFVSRLQGHGTSVAFILNWIDQSLAEQATTVSQLLHADSHEQAAEHLSISNSIGSLRFLGAMDWKRFVETLSHVEQILRRDPGGVHGAQDFATRDRYRHAIEALSRRSGRLETDVAEHVLELAVAAHALGDVSGAHVGAYLVGRRRRELRKTLGLPALPPGGICLTEACRLVVYLGVIGAGTLAAATAFAALAGLSSSSARFWWIVSAAWIPASALAVSLANFLVTLRIPPRPLPRLDFMDGIPPEHRTMVVVPTLLPDAAGLHAMLEALEIRYLGNRDPQLFFALLTDWPDADAASLPGEEGLLLRATMGIETLNARHPRQDGGTTFFLFHRPRRWNPHERCWMGYERKRGKLEEFNALLRGGSADAFSLRVGDLGILPTIRYVITLDADTDLPRGTAHRMVGAMAHPLNRPVVDAKAGRVVEGYAILQPRASIRLEAANRSLFARIACGEAGLDPYSQEVSDVYQDLFGEGSYVGKGIYDVDAFRAVIEHRFPENVILSHDLLESGYARSALLSCVELYEDAPSSYLADISRQHRWMRGDWQIARWLFPRPPVGTGREPGRNPLSLLTRWKILDNLRRSFFAPVTTLLLTVGWAFGPLPGTAWLLFALVVLFATGVLRTSTLLLRKPHERGWRTHLRTWGAAVLRQTAQPLFLLAVLPYEALVALDAFALSALRLPFTRRKLLLWHLPQYRRRNERRSLPGFLAEMAGAPAIAAAGLLLVAFRRPDQLAPAAPLFALWLLAPALAWWASLPRRRGVPTLAESQWRLLRTLSRRTWRFFDHFAGEQENWLPPDNFQEVPEPVVASRTSPTNMGFGLLANLAAWDFGYVSTPRLLERTERLLDAMERLERYRGHFYNWYDTRSLRTLLPRYVSSVDSGNLACCLLTLRCGLSELRDLPSLPPQCWSGLRDTLAVLADACGDHTSPDVLEAVRQAELLLVAPPTDACGSVTRLGALRDVAARLRDRAAQDASTPALVWAEDLVRQSEDLRDAARGILDGVNGAVPSLSALARDAARGTEANRGTATEWLRTAERLVERCQAMESAMDFRFLYDKDRELLRIGYDVDARRLDASCYDLLASEARIASFLLVAGDQAPPEHWFALGRLLAGREGNAALVSWSGSMFEYLMPALFMEHYEGTLLTQTCQAVVHRQIRYARQHHVPWGVSESCYHATDAHHTYQYRAFGVPGLGLKRGLSDDVVIAPYATLLALPFAPAEACANLERLIGQESALGEYGLYEAIDYTSSRVPRGKQRAVVRAYMSHHQGMGFLALSHLLLQGPMVRRFMSDPAVRATQVLLQERIPEVSPVVQPHAGESAATAAADTDAGVPMRVFSEVHTVAPEVHLLSNGNYSVMVTHAGGGYSRWRDRALTRWREDATLDCWGSFAYLRDVEDGTYWSSAYQPTRKAADQYEAIFTQDRAEFRRRDMEIETHTEICVSPEDDVEIRRITLTNRSRRKRLLEITSYAEVVLAPLAADLAHRVFSNLFVRTEIVRGSQAILCTRRKRAESEPEVWMFHMLVVSGQAGRPSYETDRERFLGRWGSPEAPAAMAVPPGDSRPLSGTEGAVLDPILAVRVAAEVPTEVPVVAHWISGAAGTREAALALADKYRDHHFVERAFELAWSHSQIVRRQLNATEHETQLYGRLAGSMLFAHARLRAAPTVLARNRLGPQGLWRFGISGDLPILLLRVSDIRRMGLVSEVLRAHAYWRLKGLATDLVIVNEDFSGYRATLNDSLLAAVNASLDAPLLDQPGGVFIRRIENLSDEDLVLFQSAARVVLTDSAESLREQVERRYVSRRLPPMLVPSESPSHSAPVAVRPRERILANDLGGFTPDGREYVVVMEPGQKPPAPWSNVIASPYIGTVVTEGGGMYTWVENAHEFRLTSWHNDPVSDPTAEALYLRDEESGTFASLAPRPSPGRAGYACRHGFGYTVFDHDEDGLYTELWVYVAMDAAVKFMTVKVRNHSGRARRLSVTAFFELVLGEWRQSNLMHIQTEVDPQTGAVLATNPYSRDFARRVVFAACSGDAVSVTGSRAEFLGRHGTWDRPEALRRTRLSGRTGQGFDPGAGLHSAFELADGAEREIVVVLGAADGVGDAQGLLRRYAGPAGARAALEAVWATWNRILGAVHVEVPEDPAFAFLVNGWLPYQVLSCRIWGRSGYYQSGGAYGFRDQLQDAMALLHAAPELLREQIVRCAGRQFPEGDVQHWWHPPTGAGVRTHFSDDLLWLPQAVARYVLATDDRGVLDEKVAFLAGRAPGPEEESVYEQHTHSGDAATVYEHCLRAIRHSLRFGPHGLPLIGCGDWNDGMNRVGQGGTGESVWLAWFLCDTLRLFGQVAERRGDRDFATLCRDEHESLRLRTEDAAWDGAWYRRAYYDDGTPLGSAENDECRIDSLSQSWAVLGGAARADRAHQALEAVRTELVKPADRLVLLFAPPFDRTSHDPGYIKGYPPGVRENGGQYTHGAVWTAMAFAEHGDAATAWELFRMLNPVSHSRTPEDVQTYRVEPYVMAADLYGAAPHTGRGGWTWYTGAAGWMYRLALESLVGMTRHPDHLRIEPRLPRDGWKRFVLHYRVGEHFVHIEVRRVPAGTPPRVEVDGVERHDARIPFPTNAGDRHAVVLWPSETEAL